MDRSKLIEKIKRHEGLRLKVYKCQSGKNTIGYGRNLDDKGISIAEAEMMLSNDLQLCISRVRNNILFSNKLSDNRQHVLIDMCFNMGIAGLNQFKRMLSCLEAGNWKLAAMELLDSRYAKQVGSRAIENAKLIREG